MFRHEKGKWQIKPLTSEQVNLETHQIKLFDAKGGKDRITVTSPWLTENNLKFLPLFPKVQRRTLQNRVKKLCQKVLSKNMSIHTLRHGWANYLVNDKNIALPILQQLGGWSRLDTVGIYTKANPVHAIKSAWEKF